MMTNEKDFQISDFREGTSRYQPAFVDILIGTVLVKGIEIYLDNNENPQIKFPVHEVITRFGSSEIEIISISDDLRERIVCELMDNFEDQICPMSNGHTKNLENNYNDFMPRLTRGN